jgi:nicotinamidase-related amidase
LHQNLKSATAAARKADIPVFIVPHHRFEPGDLAGWTHPTPYLAGSAKALVFQKGSWGGEWFPDFAPQPDDVVVKEHWMSSGFANTDLDFLLKQRNITHVILVGLVANTCIESTGRFAAELGYHVTLVRDATAAFSDEALHAAHEINAATYAHQLITTEELVRALEPAAS